jgi:mono/diheme cytochrome c family protein
MGSAIRRVRHAVLPALIALLITGPATAQDSAANGAATPRSTLTGAYTAEQAAEGEAVFRNMCSSCHPTSQFTGAAFQRTWSERPVFALFDQIRLMMPMDNPGGLRDEEYAAVVAYILKLNAFPAGSHPLPAQDSALKQIRFERQPDTED